MKLDEQNATLMVQFPSYNGDVTLGIGLPSLDGYVTLDPYIVATSQTIDLVGYSMDYMTFATFETMYQDPGIYYNKDAAGTAAGSLDSFQVVELVSSNPIDNVELLKIANNVNRRAPGMIGTEENFKQIIYGRYSLYVPNTTLSSLPGFMQLIQSQGFGSKEPVACDRLYCYRLLVFGGLAPPGEVVQVPACRIGLSGRFYHEKDNAYIMRLRRNLILKQTQG